MKVLHLVGGYPHGGAARGALALHKGLLKEGINSRVLIQFMDGKHERITAIGKSSLIKIKQMIFQGIEQTPTYFYRRRKTPIFSTGFVGNDLTQTEEYNWADIIHLHWICSATISTRVIGRIKKPVVWTLRDMNPFTGGCHLQNVCLRYVQECGSCPVLGSKRQNDLSRYVFKHKKANYPPNIRIVGISRWISAIAKNSSLLNSYDISTIPNAIDTDFYKPLKGQMDAENLKKKAKERIILAGATDFKVEIWKGLDKLLDALKHLEERYTVVFFGRAGIKNTGLHHEIINHGYVSSNSKMLDLYRNASIYVSPSLIEPFGKTIAESMSCGTPVVCFDATGPKDIVDHKINGFKAKAFDAQDLANGIRWLTEEADSVEVRRNAREKAVESYSDHLIAKKYMKIYDKFKI